MRTAVGPAPAPVQRRHRLVELGGSQAASLNDELSRFRTDAVAILRAAVTSSDPFPLTRSGLQRHSRFIDGLSRVALVAAGKAAWPMALAAAEAFGTRVHQGVVTGVRGAGALPSQLEWIDGSHPRADQRSVRAARRALDIAGTTREDDHLLLTLLSGGGSSMLALPVDGVTLEEKQQTIDALSFAGVPIAGINCVRKHLSAVKGGRLALATSARCLTLAVSDVHVPQDDPGTIASGPTVADPTTFRDALAAIEEARVQAPRAVRDHLERGAAGGREETAKPGDQRLARNIFDVIANRRTAMAGAASEASRRGYAVETIDGPVVGEASRAGRAFASGALDAAAAGRRCVIASGETTVTVRGDGRGGRNQEFVLGAAPVLARHAAPAVVASAGTDGIDGPTDAAGGIATTLTVDEARRRGVDLERALAHNDAYTALVALGAVIKWGPTFTNVGDVHVLLTMKA